MQKHLARSFVVAALAALVFSARTADACGDYRDFAVYEHLRKVLSEDAEESRDAIAAVRSSGARALPIVMGHLRKALAERGADGTPTAAALRARAVFDKIAGQKDALTSKLYWYTDLEEAKAAAIELGRPILSLRLLGRLDEDLSCANSRFFRTALYANGDLAKHLREKVVLHWRSVRPVPVITIDFGDGRRVCRTITGNSIHYVLDGQGRVVDALPGLYGPAAFRTALDEALEVEQAVRGLDAGPRALTLALWHTHAEQRLAEGFAADLGTIGDARLRVDPTARATSASAAPSARRAAPVARGKMVAEMPVVKALQPRAADVLESTDDATWAKIAHLHAARARLDAASIALIRTKMAGVAAASALSKSKSRIEDPVLRTVRNFERSMAEDTVRNEYDLHRRLHRWLAEDGNVAVEALNERVYAELFLTPSSDPWLGLVPADTYAALDGEGIVRR